MSTNFKTFDDFYSVIERQINNKVRNYKPRQFKLATVISVQSVTATVLFDGDTTNIAGIQIQSGVTVVATDRVKVQNINMSIQLESYIITDKY